MIRFPHTLLPLLLLFLSLPQIELQADWPRFMGNDAYTGHVAINVRPTFQPAKKWERQIGTGFSSLSAADGRLYTMGHIDGEEVVWCLRTSDGEVQWTKRYPAKLLDHLHEGGPAATPTIYKDVVYTLGKEGMLYCLNRNNGDEHWRVDINQRFKLKTPEWGYASSPLIVDTPTGPQLLLDVGPTICLEATTGKTRWKTKTYKSGYGSVVGFNSGNHSKTYYAVLNNAGLLILDANDGSEIAFHKWLTSFDTNSTTPIILENDHIFISTAYNQGCTLLKFENQTLTALRDTLLPKLISGEVRVKDAEQLVTEAL